MIAKHKLPATVIYENKTVLHFLIKKPVSLHLVPRKENDGLDLWFEPKNKGGKTPSIDYIVLKKLKDELRNKQ